MVEREREEVSEPRQLTFDLPHLPALEAEDFVVSACNQHAVDLIERWPAWSASAAIVAGPPGSGKSHLVSVWLARSGGTATAMADLSAATIETFAQNKCLAVEDVAAGGGEEPERLLFHLLNQARETGGSLLITMRRPPGELVIGLPDLRSRLRAAPIARIEPIDDALLSALLIKLFADRQLAVDPGVVKYLTRHLERSAEAARETIERIDHLALATHRKVTRQLAAEALAASAGAVED
jgi:chromosomal replication initiation ATPase DnaA